jgi:hypothetical protein
MQAEERGMSTQLDDSKKVWASSNIIFFLRMNLSYLEVLLSDLLGFLLAELPLELPLLHLPQPQRLRLGPVLNLEKKIKLIYRQTP